MEDRITELEIRIGFQQDTIEQLNGVVLEFTQRVEQLERKLEEYRQLASENQAPVGPADDKPPHY